MSDHELKEKSSTVWRNGTLIFPLLSLVAITIFIVLLNSNSTPANTAAKRWVNAWQPLPPFNYARRGLTAIAANGYLYVIGGVDSKGDYVRPVEFAPILDNGKLGAWQTTTELTEGRFYLASAYSNGYIYALGGAIGPLGADNIPSATVERAPILANGQLGPWMKTAYLTTPRRGLQAVAYQNHIYAIGGYNGVFLHSVERAEILPDNTISPWQEEKEQSITERYIHSATIYNHRLYLLGGHVQHAGSMVYGDVEMSAIGTNGRIGPWEIEKTELKIPRFLASAFAINNYLYLLGGHDGSRRLRETEYASIDPQGHVSSWQLTASLNADRSATATAVFQKYVYVLGGMSGDQVLNTGEMAMQGAAGQLGHLTAP